VRAMVSIIVSASGVRAWWLSVMAGVSVSALHLI
jgi:hypothetical protein